MATTDFSQRQPDATYNRRKERDTGLLLVTISAMGVGALALGIIHSIDHDNKRTVAARNLEQCVTQIMPNVKRRLAGDRVIFRDSRGEDTKQIVGLLSAAVDANVPINLQPLAPKVRQHCNGATLAYLAVR